MLQSVGVVREDIRMEFGIEKRAIIVKKRGKLVTTEGIAIPGERLIRAMNEGDVDAYKYLGVLEGEEIKHTEMKRRIEKEHFRRAQTILKSELNGGKMVQAINCTAVAVVGYAAGTVEWTKEEQTDDSTSCFAFAGWC